MDENNHKKTSQSVLTPDFNKADDTKERGKETKFHMFWHKKIKQQKQICDIPYVKYVKKPPNDRFLRQIVTTDERWIYFRNPDKTG